MKLRIDHPYRSVMSLIPKMAVDNFLGHTPYEPNLCSPVSNIIRRAQCGRLSGQSPADAGLTPFKSSRKIRPLRKLSVRTGCPADRAQHNRRLQAKGPDRGCQGPRQRRMPLGQPLWHALALFISFWPSSSKSRSDGNNHDRSAEQPQNENNHNDDDDDDNNVEGSSDNVKMSSGSNPPEDPRPVLRRR